MRATLKKIAVKCVLFFAVSNIVGSVVPNSALGQIIRQQPKSSLLTQDEAKKASLRNKLKESYDPSPLSMSYQIRNIENLQPGKANNEQRNPISDKKLLKSEGGAWTGGGGSGIACLAPNRSIRSPEYSDSLGRLRPEKYNDLIYLSTLDVMADSLQAIPAEAKESPAQYIERLLTRYLSPTMPLLAMRLSALSKMVADQLDQQIHEFQSKPQPNPQLTLRDFGLAMYDKEQSLRPECKALQLATRYARLSTFQVHEFFIDFDVSLILRMRELSSTPTETVLKEAGLILHEALYLAGSALGQPDSSWTAFGIIPFLLDLNSMQPFESMPRGLAIQKMREKMEEFGILGSPYISFQEAFMPVNSKFQTRSAALSELSKIFHETDEKYLTDTNRFNRDPWMLEEARRVMMRNPEISRDTRASPAWNKICFDLLEKRFDNELSFLALAISTRGAENIVVDDLFVSTAYSAEAKKTYCQLMKKEWDEVWAPNLPYRNLEKAYSRAFEYCNTKN